MSGSRSHHLCKGRAAWVGVCVGATLALSAPRLNAQEPLVGIRMIATYNPASDARTFEVLEPLSGSEILALQAALARVGGDPGPLDGRLGPGTLGALERFQRERGLRVCGCVTYETIIALALRPLVVQTVIGPAAEAHDIEVILPTGPPPARQELPAVPAAPAVPAGEGAEPTRTQPASHLDAGWWVPVFPLHPPFLEPMRGSGGPGRGKGGDRGGTGGRGGILIGPGATGGGVRTGGVRVISPPARGAPRPAPPRRPRPPK
jgi:peptidoglycan hydrolase-like protein with peptidoglycan-binding domain